MSTELLSILLAGDSHAMGYPKIEGDVPASSGTNYAVMFAPVWFGTAYEVLDLVVTYPDGRTGLNPKFADQTRMWPGLDVKGRPRNPDQRVRKALVLSFGTAVSNYDPAIDIDDRKVESVMFPRGVDFVLPERPEMPVDPSCRLVPAALITEMYAAMLTPLRTALGILAEDVTPSLYLIGSPPPARDETKRRDLFANRSAKMGVSPVALPSAEVMLKTWMLVSKQVEKLCADTGCTFIPALNTACDADGYLKPEFEGDGVHANASYNKHAVRHIIDVVVQSTERARSASS